MKNVECKELDRELSTLWSSLAQASTTEVVFVREHTALGRADSLVKQAKVEQIVKITQEK